MGSWLERRCYGDSFATSGLEANKKRSGSNRSVRLQRGAAQLTLVSVIVPCFNQGRYLVDALESVLAQSYPSWQCIVVNDGSTGWLAWQGTCEGILPGRTIVASFGLNRETARPP